MVVEAGAEAKSDTETAIVGYSGELYLENPKAGQQVEITDKQGKCTIQLPAVLPKFEEVQIVQCKR